MKMRKLYKKDERSVKINSAKTKARIAEKKGENAKRKGGDHTKRRESAAHGN